MSIEKKIIYYRQAAYRQSVGFAIDISMQNSDPTPQGVEYRNIVWFKCVLTALHVSCMILTRTGKNVRLSEILL